MMSGTHPYDRSGLLGEIRQRFRLDWHGIHGAHHWGRVRHHARALAVAREADVIVVELFAFLHASQRHDDYEDRQHGERGAEFARALQGRHFDLGERQLSRLTQAIRHHSGGEVSTDATIQCCWDADRLDLGRVGIRPHPRFLSDHAAARIGPAYGWSRGRRRKA